jgi:hypothetical protein
MSKCKVCKITINVPEEANEANRCGFCGGQGQKTFLCDNHRYLIISHTGTVSAACEKCKIKKTTKGLWTLVEQQE